MPNENKKIIFATDLVPQTNDQYLGDDDHQWKIKGIIPMSNGGTNSNTSSFSTTNSAIIYDAANTKLISSKLIIDNDNNNALLKPLTNSTISLFVSTSASIQWNNNTQSIDFIFT